MSIVKTLFGNSVSVPQRGEKGWGADVTNILSQLIDGVGGAINLVSGIAFIFRSRANTTVTAGLQITITSNTHKLTAASAVTLNTTNPLTAGLSTGQELRLIGTSDTNTITIKHSPGGTPATKLNGTMVLGEDDCIDLEWNGTIWQETSRSS
jgi:hypothetical protein